MGSFSTLNGFNCSTTAKKCVNVNDTLTSCGKPKEKRRNNEKRKEKSRDAARVRRSCETEIFNSLADELPLEKEDVKSLDKASIMRIAIAFLKVRTLVKLFSSAEDKKKLEVNFNSPKGQETEDEVDELCKNAEKSLMLQQTLNGFLLILTNDGDIAYVSESITEYLGLSKIDLLGQPIWEYAHQCDHAEIKDTLNLKRLGICEKQKDTMNADANTYYHDIFVRLKCTLTGRRRSINFKSASYKVMRLTGHLVVSKTGERVLVGICSPIPHPSNIEVPLEPTTFLTKHSMDMKFTHIDDKLMNILDYNKEDLLQKSAFDFHHGADSSSLMTTFKSVLSKGQGETCRYRFLGKYGGYCWIVTQATILYEKNQPQSVICVNYVISQLENNNEIYSLAQYEASKKKFEKGESLQQLPKENNSAQNKLQAQIKLQQQQEEGEQEKSNENKNLINKINSEQILINEQINKENETDIKLKQLKTLTTVQLKLEKEHQQQQYLTGNGNTEPTIYVESLLCGGEIKPLQKISVAASAHTATRAIFAASTANNTNNKNIDNQYYKSKLIDENRPKSVTASVFTPIVQLVNKQNQQSIVKLPTTTTTSTLQTIKPLNPQQQERLKQRTQIMNQEFFTYNHNATKITMLKEDPDDLSHLDSNAIVDECRPLDETPLFNDVLAGLMSSYDGLLPDEINSLDSSTSSIGEVVTIDGQIFNSNNNNNDNNQVNHNITTALDNIGLIETKVNNKNQMNNNTATFNNLNNEKHGLIDPFINHREESNDTNHSQHLSSLTVTSTSPEGSSLPSLCSPHSVCQDDEFAFMRMNDDEIDLTMRAPYIPMNEQDDLPLLTADDLMWCDNNTFTTDELNIKDADVMQIELNDTQIQHHQQQQQQQQQQQEQQQQQHQHQLQQQHRMQTNNLNNLLTYQQIQQQQQQHQYLLQQQEQLQLENTLTHVHRLHDIEQQALLQQQLQTDSTELAALLCGTGNVNTMASLLDNCNNCNNSNEQQFWNNNLRVQQIQQQQQLQQQQPTRNLTSDCKKEKFDRTCPGDAIDDVYEQIYNKESTNLDCWNDLLQINGQDVAITNSNTEVVSLLQEHQHQQQQQQILLNDEKNKSILNEKFLTTPMIVMRNKNVLEDIHVNGNGSGNGNGFNLNRNAQQQQQQQHQQLVINIQQQKQQQSPPHPHGNKRQYSTTTKTSSTTTNKSSDLSSELTEGLAKRIKNTNQKTKASPQLLHHLMTTTTTKQQQQQQQQTVGSTTTTAQVIQLKNNKQKSNTTHKQNAVPTLQQQTDMQQKTKTNSVLKNLLVSGCDEIIPIKDEISTQENLLIGPNTDAAINLNEQALNMLKNVSHNPLIGGTDICKEDSILPNPLLVVEKNEENLQIYTFNKNMWPKTSKIIQDPLKSQVDSHSFSKEVKHVEADTFLMDLGDNDYTLQTESLLSPVELNWL